ncbi:hypothetical protein [Microbacterium gubbeenense]|uniref:hypothetical protein n=1 Tax=Microbacterium gubbeenense TaxID=159896 RepID=UPI003F9ADCF6
MRHLRSLTVIASTTLAVGVLAGCSGESEKGLTYEDSPLSKYMSSLYDAEMSPEDQQADMEAQELEQEEAVASCMQEEGFEYVPYTGTSVIAGDDDAWDPDSRDWVEKYGYGIFSSPWDDEEAVDEEMPEDPNQEYVDSLSESERMAYESTLYGETPSDEQAEDPEFDWNSLDQGCYGTAMNETQNMSEIDALYEEFDPLMTKMSELYEAALASDDMVELDAEWAACMADTEFTEFAARAEAEASMYEEQEKLYEEQNAVSEEIDWDSASAEEAEELMNASDPMSTPEWAEAADKERALALADFDCRAEIDYDATSLSIQFELEEQFIADNKADLEAFRAAAEQVM